MKIVLFGASGELAQAVARAFLGRGWEVVLVTRKTRKDVVEFAFSNAEGKFSIETVGRRYSEFVPAEEGYDVALFAQALFEPAPLTEMGEETIETEIDVGLTDIICLSRKLLRGNPPTEDRRRDFCYIGSTSAYAGFRNTSVYCAVKHGLLGFVRAMNDEHARTGHRFWLFSMGTMDTAMGRKLVEQDSTSFLPPTDVALRIVASVANVSNLFEPEVVMRRRIIRFLGK